MNNDCTIYKTVDFISKRWTLLILLELYKRNPKRYSELKRDLETITPKILSLRLKELEKEGLISKKIDATEFPVKSEYFLTESGMNFIGVIKKLKRWGLKWKFDSEECNRKDCRQCEF